MLGDQNPFGVLCKVVEGEAPKCCQECGSGSTGVLSPQHSGRRLLCVVFNS